MRRSLHNHTCTCKGGCEFQILTALARQGRPCYQIPKDMSLISVVVADWHGYTQRCGVLEKGKTSDAD